MKAAVVEAPDETPKYRDFTAPAHESGYEMISVRAAALSNLAKSRASGAHYSASGSYPAVVGVDGVGVTQDGRRVYFVLPEAPYGAMSEKTTVRVKQCLALPHEIDDITAAAIANPGMSAWAALAERAQLKAGETVLVNGATGAAGRVAVQIAKYMGASRVIATGRDQAALEQVSALGADAVIPFKLDVSNPNGGKEFEAALIEEFAKGIDVVVDCLWGESAAAIITAIVKAVEDASPVRFIQVGSVSGDAIQMPGSAPAFVVHRPDGQRTEECSDVPAACRNRQCLSGDDSREPPDCDKGRSAGSGGRDMERPG